MKTVAVTGAGKKLGKTLVACAVISGFTRAGFRVSAFKLRPIDCEGIRIRKGAGREGCDTYRFLEAGAVEAAIIDFPDVNVLASAMEPLVTGSDVAVVEGGSAVPALDPDILIYIDGNIAEPLHSDLRKLADINVTGVPGEEQLHRIAGLCKALLRMGNTESFEVDMKCWINLGDTPILGEGICRLLAAILETGSILSAADVTGIPYKRAWVLINEAEEKLGARLLHSKRGGIEGGGSSLTVLGRILLASWERAESALSSVIDSLEV